MTDRADHASYVQKMDWTQGERFLAIAAGTGFAVAQPALSLFGSIPVLFTFNGIGGFALVWIALFVAIVPGVVLCLLDVVVSRRAPKVGRYLHLGVMWMLFAIFLVPIVKFGYSVTNPYLVALFAGVMAAAVTAAYLILKPMAMLLRAASILPLVAMLYFLLASDSAALIARQEAIAPVEVAGGTVDTPVVFLLLDELPTKSILDGANEIDRNRYPHLAEFADEATWHRYFTTNATLTLRAAPAILAGRDGDQTTAYWRDYPENIFTMLAPTHEMHVYESLTDLCGFPECNKPQTWSRFYGQAFRTFGGRISPATHEISFGDFFEERVDNPDETHADHAVLPERFEQFLAAIGPDDGPSLHFLHMTLPHQPWRYFPDGQEYHIDEHGSRFPSVARRNEQGEWVAALSEQRHLLQTSYTDHLVGRMTARLKDAGVFDDALVIIAADHGISFKENTQIRETTDETLDSVVYSPLLIKYPQQSAGRIDDSNTMSIDLLPTIASVLGLAPPTSAQGLAIGSPQQLARDDTKYVLDVADDSSRTIRGVIEFDAQTHFPDPADRWNSPSDGSESLAIRAGIADFLGQSMDELQPAKDGGEATIDSLANHLRPGVVPEAIVVGRSSAATAGRIIVAVDGIIVTGSPLYEFNGVSGSFAAMLPRSVVGANKNLRIAVITEDGRISELDIRQ